MLHDKTSRELKNWEITSPDSIRFLFTALGGLEWTKVKFLPGSIHIGAKRKKVYWNILYALRWVLIIDRLRLDIEKHNIKNHYNINYEKIVFEDEQEISKLKNIFGVSGPLKIPVMDRSRVYKHESYILHNMKSASKTDAQQTFKMIYELCESYLHELGHERTIRFMKNNILSTYEEKR